MTASIAAEERRRPALDTQSSYAAIVYHNGCTLSWASSSMDDSLCIHTHTEWCETPIIKRLHKGWI